MRPTAKSITRFGRIPPTRKHLRVNTRTGLPTPQTSITIHEFASSRLGQHYATTLADDLMYMSYIHPGAAGARPPRQIRLTFDPSNPYTKHRHNPPVGGSQVGRKPAPVVTPQNVVRLEKISIHTMVKESVTNRSQLLPAIMALRALTGETYKGGGHHAVEGIQIARGKKSVGGWIRPGIPVGVKVDLRGASMYEFLGTLVEFVLPRLRDFNGVILPPASSSTSSPSAVSGVVSFGLPPQALVFFPQIDVNVDSYPKLPGIHIHFVTNATGVGAQDRARALVSGFQVPFLRR